MGDHDMITHMSKSESADSGKSYLLSLHRQKIGYDNGYWVTFRVTEVPPDEGRPWGFQYALTLHDENDDRILGYDNSHSIDAATGPAKKSKRQVAFDHIDRRGKRSVPYQFTTPYQLVEDFLADVEKILREEGVL